MSHLFKSCGDTSGKSLATGEIPEVYQEVFSGQYELPLKQSPKTVLDIGANEGAFTSWALQKWPQCTISAFEPAPENIESFERNHFPSSRIHFFGKAIWTQPRATLLRGKNNSGECSFYDLGEQTNEQVEVDCIHPSLLESAEFVKVDAEGCEVEIIKALDLSATQALACEYHRPEDKETIIDYLKGRGFRLFSCLRLNAKRGVLKFHLPGAIDFQHNAKKRSVFMATTALWSVDPHFFQCCLKAQQELLVKSLAGIGVINGRFPELYAGESPVGRSRNSLTAQFLASDCTDILFIDSDLVFSASQVERIVQFEEDVVGGAYCFKAQGRPRICCNPKQGATEIKDNGLMEVAYIGTGFLRVRRSVFERIIEKFGEELWYKTDDGKNDLQHDFWQMGIYKYPDGSRRWLSEDWYFCQRCADLGIKVWCDMNCLLGHSGNAVYPLETQLEQLYTQEQLERMKLSAKADGAGSENTSTSPSVTESAQILTPV